MKTTVRIDLVTGEHFAHEVMVDRQLQYLRKILRDGYWFYEGYVLTWYSPRMIDKITLARS